MNSETRILYEFIANHERLNHLFYQQSKTMDTPALAQSIRLQITAMMPPLLAPFRELLEDAVAEVDWPALAQIYYSEPIADERKNRQ